MEEMKSSQFLYKNQRNKTNEIKTNNIVFIGNI